MKNFITSVTSVLVDKPEFGIVSSMLAVAMSPLQVMQMIGAILGILIAILTGIIKVIELREKLSDKKKSPIRKKKRTEEIQ